MAAGLGYIVGYLEEKKIYEKKDELFEKKTKYFPLLYSIIGIIIGGYFGKFIENII
tara:strand:+ start:689 stop:856 length:168 start_codon:yes stop_codon:yes gene_type:complete